MDSKTKQPVAPTTVQKETVPPKAETPVAAKPVKKKRRGAAILFVLFLICGFGTLFTIFGVYVARSVVPEIQNWLVSHNFVASPNSNNGQDKSPFVPQNNDSVGKTGDALTIPQVVKKASPSVVSIAIAGEQNPVPGTEEEFDKIGTGFIVDAKGIVVTNQHVVRDLKAEYQVITQDNKSYKAKTIVRDEVNDIAIIVVDANNLPALPIGNSASIEVGETVIAIGTPLGEYPGSVTVGVISGVGRSVRTGDGFWEAAKEYENVLQTDAAVNPGNSGGPLLNLFGEVVGVNFATTSGADNISFALPIDIVAQRVSEYKQYGKFRTPYLGVNYRMVLAQEAEFYNVEPGALVRTVAKDSPAEKSGLRVGDIITKINGKVVTTSLAATLSRSNVGDEISITVVRTSITGNSETVTLKATLSERPASE